MCHQSQPIRTVPHLVTEATMTNDQDHSQILGCRAMCSARLALCCLMAELLCVVPCGSYPSLLGPEVKAGAQWLGTKQNSECDFPVRWNSEPMFLSFIGTSSNSLGCVPTERTSLSILQLLLGHRDRDPVVGTCPWRHRELTFLWGGRQLPSRRGSYFCDSSSNSSRYMGPVTKGRNEWQRIREWWESLTLQQQEENNPEDEQGL